MTIEHLTPIHPGLVLQDELDELEISQTRLAQHIGVLPKTINEICRGKRAVDGSDRRQAILCVRC
jgi:antitoxin HigA-1